MEEKISTHVVKMKIYETLDFKIQLITLRKDFKLQAEKTELTLEDCMLATAE